MRREIFLTTQNIEATLKLNSIKFGSKTQSNFNKKIRDCKTADLQLQLRFPDSKKFNKFSKKNWKRKGSSLKSWKTIAI